MKVIIDRDKFLEKLIFGGMTGLISFEVKNLLNFIHYLLFIALFLNQRYLKIDYYVSFLFIILLEKNSKNNVIKVKNEFKNN